jgi:hypothetical protein
MSNKRVLYKRNGLYVGNWRENALHWLNGDLQKRYYSNSARRRIDQLIEALQTLSRLKPSFKEIERASSDTTAPFSRISIQMSSEARDAIKIVERLISRYPSWPTLGLDKEGNLSFGRLSSRLKRADEEEAEAALAVMSLAEANELIRLRRCLCGRWFFACRKAQRSCSANCRHKLYEQTEGFKAKRRKYMQRYYRLQRSGKVK